MLHTYVLRSSFLISRFIFEAGNYGTLAKAILVCPILERISALQWPSHVILLPK